MAEPYPKSRQLRRGEKRYRRIVASPKQWAAIVAEKQGPCRVCLDPAANGRLYGRVEFHHLVRRGGQFGDDVADNIVPLCSDCHAEVTAFHLPALLRLGETLTAAERAYCVGKLGAEAVERLFGVGR